MRAARSAFKGVECPHRDFIPVTQFVDAPVAFQSQQHYRHLFLPIPLLLGSHPFSGSHDLSYFSVGARYKVLAE